MTGFFLVSYGSRNCETSMGRAAVLIYESPTVKFLGMVLTEIWNLCDVCEILIEVRDQS